MLVSHWQHQRLQRCEHQLILISWWGSRAHWRRQGELLHWYCCKWVSNPTLIHSIVNNITAGMIWVGLRSSKALSRLMGGRITATVSLSLGPPTLAHLYFFLLYFNLYQCHQVPIYSNTEIHRKIQSSLLDRLVWTHCRTQLLFFFFFFFSVGTTAFSLIHYQTSLTRTVQPSESSASLRDVTTKGKK